jgi:hypothetical protein
MCERCSRQLKLSKNELSNLILKFESHCTPLGRQSKAFDAGEQGGDPNSERTSSSTFTREMT